MSWDVLLLRLPEEIVSLADVPQGFSLSSIGSPEHVAAAVTRHCPEAEVFLPENARAATRHGRIDFTFLSDDDVNAVMVCAEGSRDDVAGVVAGCADDLGCAVLDCYTGRRLDLTGARGA